MFYYTAVNGDPDKVASHFYKNEVDAAAEMEWQNTKSKEMGLETTYEVCSRRTCPEGVKPR